MQTSLLYPYTLRHFLKKEIVYLYLQCVCIYVFFFSKQNNERQIHSSLKQNQHDSSRNCTIVSHNQLKQGLLDLGHCQELLATAPITSAVENRELCQRAPVNLKLTKIPNSGKAETQCHILTARVCISSEDIAGHSNPQS